MAADSISLPPPVPPSLSRVSPFSEGAERTALKVIKWVAIVGLFAGLAAGATVAGMYFHEHHSYAFMKSWEFLLPTSIALASLGMLIVRYAQTTNSQRMIANAEVAYSDAQSDVDASGMILKINGKTRTLAQLREELGPQRDLAKCASQTILNEGTNLATAKWYQPQGALMTGLKNQPPEFDFRTGFWGSAIETIVVTKMFALVEEANPDNVRGRVKMTVTINAADPTHPTFTYS